MKLKCLIFLNKMMVICSQQIGTEWTVSVSTWREPVSSHVVVESNVSPYMKGNVGCFSRKNWYVFFQNFEISKFENFQKNIKFHIFLENPYISLAASLRDPSLKKDLSNWRYRENFFFPVALYGSNFFVFQYFFYKTFLWRHLALNIQFLAKYW